MARVRKEMHAAVTTGSAETSRPSLRDGFNVCSVLSPGTGLSCPVASAPRPVRIMSHRLGASIGAPGPHGLNVREQSIVQRKAPDKPAATAPRLYVS
ncbi:conserved protein of unknown function [Bradyrhizobium sp. ORS 285]|nr:conserved hypothetical protein [Bradyrhizobium sp. ORS 285]SMX62230.1 conserved protein of unknown function [Bradyrhizobium sp. ORS 285]